MTIICKNTGSTKLLTVSNTYNVIEETESRYAILNDRGIQKNYSKDLFSIQVPPEPARVIAPPVVVVAPATIVISEITVDTSFIGTKDDEDDDDDYDEDSNGDYDGRLTSLVTIGIGERILRLTSSIVLDVYDSSISCGIRDIQGSQILISQLTIDIAEALLQDFIAKFQNDTYNVGLLTVSTNITNNTHFNEEFIGLLDGIASSKIEFQNPNSGNRCAQWPIAVNE